MSRILIFGGMGMLGHTLASSLVSRHEVTVVIRDSIESLPHGYAEVGFISCPDLCDAERLGCLLDPAKWDAVVNAVGLVKQKTSSESAVEAIAVNALMPQVLASLCTERGIRLIHFSTDCVFSGSVDSSRGPDGYRLEDPPDARDLYGLSKLLGEATLRGCVCLRLSLIGRELRGHHGLLDWYLRQVDEPVRGFTQAFFTGITTPVAARLVDFLVAHRPDVDGLWHVAGAPISKFDLLQLIRTHFERGARIVPDHEFYCDRRLDGSVFGQYTGWKAPDWIEMIKELAAQDQQCDS